ncbi:hypothetical protein SAMN04487914_13249 [Arthrobacter sp. ok909]|uniref:hypothetical protein n=1 Tax=Arthrobacter sp. ok909 TaxID=1761746 RepID=UPI00088AFFB4|nr:hypothetical protein [Arthrobacter sp. ok909]SDP74180.1 hypothetical protein SAMN04487914_13249 [Arthrobacter sp. ok909]
MGSEGFDALIDDITARVEEAIPGASFKAMEHVREIAVSRALLETGNLRTSAETIPAPNGAAVYFPGPYSRYQEFGISHSGEQLRHETGQSLYLTSTIIQEAPKVLEILETEIRSAIE